MWNKPTKEQLASTPALYGTENTPLKDKPIYLHFFIGNCDWYAIEFDGDDTFWGFAILNNDFQMAEFGYFSLEELSSIRVKGFYEIENDLFWQVRPAHQVERICRAQGWPLPEHQDILEIECPNCKKITRSGLGEEISCPECKVIILQKSIAYQGGFSHGLYS
jgi:hypothetical protein